MAYKKGLTGEALTSIIFWIVFFFAASAAIYFLIRKFA